MSEKDEVWYLMLENVHVVIYKENYNFWCGEIYDEEDFREAGLNLNLLLERGICKLWKKEDDEEEESYIIKKKLSYREGFREGQIERARELVEKAIEMFIEKRVTFSRAAQLADIPQSELMDILKSRGIPYMEYTEEEFKQDMKTTNDLEKQELSHISDEKLASRLDLPEEQWLTIPEGMSIGEWAKMIQAEQKKDSEK